MPVTTMRERNTALRDLGAQMLPGVMVPTHKQLPHGKLVQVITVAELAKAYATTPSFYVVYRDEEYRVLTKPLEDFRLRFAALGQ